MRKFALPAIAGLAALTGATMLVSSAASAQPFGGPFGGPGPFFGPPPVVMPVQGWGPGYGPGYGPGWGRPHYGYGRPVCVVRPVIVETPWGPRSRPVRVCR